MVTAVTNIYLAYTLYIIKHSIKLCYSENSAQINLLVLLEYSCSRAVKVGFESIYYICCSF